MNGGACHTGILRTVPDRTKLFLVPGYDRHAGADLRETELIIRIGMQFGNREPFGQLAAEERDADRNCNPLVFIEFFSQKLLKVSISFRP